tara:strand:- start:586 stop:1338 length:753 start_codon:yes stop_codon:yes gene_type:complete
MSNDPNKCIVSGFGGSAHPYNYCVKPLDQMIDYDRLKGAGSMNMKALEEYASGAINYATSLVSNPSRALANECLNKLGNKYFLKTESKCADGNNIHKYINNMDYYNIITGRKSSGNDGIIPAAVSSATKINALGVFNAIIGEAVPECVKVTAPCHIVDKKNSYNSYFGYSPGVHISKSDYESLVNDGENITLINEPFSNINKSDSNINKSDSNIKLLNAKLFKNDVLSNVYIISLIGFLLLITYKLMHKK